MHGSHTRCVEHGQVKVGSSLVRTIEQKLQRSLLDLEFWFVAGTEYDLLTMCPLGQ
jgi:hypothetical protein